MQIEYLYIISGIILIAFLYSSVGHGGASGYLALMSIVGFSTEIMRPTALIINICVSGIAFYHYSRAGFFRKELFLPLAICSVPMAFLGAQIRLDDFWYKRILALCLIFACIRILGFIKASEKQTQKMPLWAAIASGSLLGLVSGMIGIGGGILLSPLLLLFNWASVKETASISASFIFVNSIAGIMGMYSKGIHLSSDFLIWILPALIGGIAGSYWGSRNAGILSLKNILAVVMFTAAIKLFIE